MNDYKELVKELKRNGLSNGGALGHHSGLCDEAADAIEQLVRERDAAVNWLPHQCNLCKHCHPANGIHCAKGGCADWKRRENWEWRGVQE